MGLKTLDEIGRSGIGIWYWFSRRQEYLILNYYWSNCNWVPREYKSEVPLHSAVWSVSQRPYC